MITGTLILVAVLLGYAITVGCSLVVTFGLASASPDFVAQDHRITAGYKRVQALLWLACVTAGGFVACSVSRGTSPIVVETLLTGSLIGMLWFNTWEARQRGVAHQILLSLVSPMGVVAGCELAKHFLKV
jgi:H+/Cl- antiporter ClcA